LLGVFHPDLVGIQVRVLQRLGSRHVLVVHGVSGLDEISLSGETMVGELVNGEVREYTIRPEQFGIAAYDGDALRVADASASKEKLLGVLDNRPGPERDIVLLNTGAALYAADVCGSIVEGVRRATEAIAAGAARAKLDEFVAFTRRYAT
jgi:anthranilate phosphoribosyltransferase